MNSKELRKLSRKEILEILLEQTKRIEILEYELEQTKKELNEKKSSLKNVGSLAEASLVLSNIFKTADEAANIYIENIKELAIKEEKNTKKELRELKKKKIEEIEKECEKRILNAEKEVQKIKNKNINQIKDIKKEKNSKNKNKSNNNKTKRKK